MQKNYIIFIILYAMTFFNNAYAESKITVGAGLLISDIKGDIENFSGNYDFDKDLGYSKFNASYFSLEARHDFEYIPDVYFDFFNSEELVSRILTKDIEVADLEHSSGDKISSSIKYNIFNILLFDSLLIKGKANSKFLGKRSYPGDIEFRFGMAVKYIDWKYDIVNKTQYNNHSWIKVNEFIPLPYFGFRYYRYGFSLYGNLTAISFKDAKSFSAEGGASYSFLKDIAVNIGYMYENFDVLEDHDMVYYQINGVKIDFKYSF